MRCYWICLVIVIVWSCQKDDGFPKHFEPGVVIVGIRDTTSVAYAFTVFRDYNLHVKEVGGFTYYTRMGMDRVAFVDSLLKTKPYLYGVGGEFRPAATYISEKAKIRFFGNLFDLDRAEQKDWLVTLTTLEAYDANVDAKFMIIQVPDGQEKDWVLQLRQHPMVRWAELNAVLRIRR